jgi:hypothetical protein
MYRTVYPLPKHQNEAKSSSSNAYWAQSQNINFFRAITAISSGHHVKAACIRNTANVPAVAFEPALAPGPTPEITRHISWAGHDITNIGNAATLTIGQLFILLDPTSDQVYHENAAHKTIKTMTNAKLKYRSL